MMRALLAALILIVLAPTVEGVSDPRPDVVGVYFDEYGDQICLDNLLPYTPFSVWIVYTNPTVPAILGFELGYRTTTQFTELSYFPPCGLVWVAPPDWEDLYVACGSPILTAVATPLVRIEYIWLGAEPLDAAYFVEKAAGSVQPGNNPYLLLPDMSFLEAQSGAVAYTSGDCSVATEMARWGAIKSLFR